MRTNSIPPANIVRTCDATSTEKPEKCEEGGTVPCSGAEVICDRVDAEEECPN
ncbi:MAG: hypothetical protein ACRC0J_03145 [Shewanella oncorhynchi]